MRRDNMQPGADLSKINRTISFASLLIAGMLFEIWMIIYKEINFDFTNTPKITVVIQTVVAIFMVISLIGLIWYGLVKSDGNERE